MIPDFQQFVPSEVCLTCEGCCRFIDAGSPWRPKMGAQETAEARAIASMKKVFSSQTIDENGYISTLPYQDMHICHFFAPQHNACGIYPGRPFECQLYPFLLTGKKGHAAVGVHLLCPYIQEHKDSEPFKRYVLYLKGFFKRDDVRSLLRRNPVLLGDYSAFKEEWEELFHFALEPGKGG